MITIENLLSKIEFPEKYIKELLEVYNSEIDINFINDFNIMINNQYDDYLIMNKKYSHLNNLSIIWLVLFLKRSLNTYSKYLSLSIPKNIFFETMKVFTRCIKENDIIHNKLLFNKEHWVSRHINLQIFRLGTLEFELTENIADIIIDNKLIEKKGEMILKIHIPTDSLLTTENIQNSLNQARLFFKKHFRNYSNLNIYCNTWLLSPQLTILLKSTSNILTFQKFFKIYDYEDSTSFKYWIFGDENLNNKDLPENSSLQKIIKKYLMNGGEIQNGCGIILD